MRNELWKSKEGSSGGYGRKSQMYVVMYTNIRSMMNKHKQEDLLCRMKEDNMDIVGISESWTQYEIEDAEINIEG